MKLIVVAGQGPSPGAEPARAEGENRGGLGPAGAGVHPERGQQPEDPGSADHRRAGETHPQEVAVSLSGQVEIPGG